MIAFWLPFWIICIVAGGGLAAWQAGLDRTPGRHRMPADAGRHRKE